jgi:hypothetical protein
MEVFCSQPAEDTTSEAVSPNAGYKEESEVSAKVREPSVVMNALIVSGVVLICVIG